MSDEHHNQHRQLERGCGRHYGFDQECLWCQVRKKADDEIRAQWKAKQAEKAQENTGNRENQG